MKPRKERVIERDAYTCQICGFVDQEGGRNLKVIHVLEKRLGGTAEPENLDTVCYLCDRKLNAGQMRSPISRTEFAPNGKVLKHEVSDLTRYRALRKEPPTVPRGRIRELRAACPTTHMAEGMESSTGHILASPARP